MNKIIRSGILLLAAVLAFCSCQKTPEEEVVRNKSDSNLQQEILQPNNQTDEEGSPSEDEISNLTDSFAKDNIQVNINATVKYPSNDSLPVYSAVPASMSQEKIKEFIKVCVGDAVTYSNTDTIYTKEEYAELIVQLKELLAKWKNFDNLSEEEQFALREGDATPEENIAALESEISKYEEEMKNAPDVHSDEQTSLELNNGILALMADAGGLEPATITFFEPYSMMYFKDGDPYYPTFAANDPQIQEKARESLAIGEEDAIKIAKSTMTALGMVDISVDSVIPAFSSDETFAYFAVKFVSTIDGVPISAIDTVAEDSSGNTDIPDSTEEYAAPLLPPNLQVYVDTNGEVRAIICENLLEIGKCVNEDVKRIDVEEALSIFKNNIFLKIWVADTSIDDEISIEKIQLSLMPVRQKDMPTEVLIIPVWDFIGTNTWNISDIDEPLTSREGSLLTINAVDGSIVDRKKGY